MCCVKTTFWILSAAILLNTSAWSQFPTTVNTEEKRVRVEQSVLIVDDQPFFARVIQHNGESFSYLKNLGFNVVQLSVPATPSQLDEASKLGIWIVCPPPSSIRFQGINSKFDPVIAWSAGDRLVARHNQIVQRVSQEIRDADKKMQRPVFANINSSWQSNSNSVDIVGLGLRTIGSNFPTKDYDRYLRSIARVVTKPIWADIQTETSRTLEKQIAGFIGGSSQLPLEHQQLKFQLYEALMGGARGVRFLSTTRLDSPDPTNQLRSASLAWLLQHCQQIETWVAGGLLESVVNKRDLEVYSLKLSGSQLLLVQRPTGFEHRTCGDPVPQTIQFQSSVGTGDRVYVVDERGVNPLATEPTTSRSYIRIPDCPYVATLLVTQDPVAVQIANPFGVTDSTLLQSRRNLNQQSVAFFELVEQRLAATGIGFPLMGTARQSAENDLASCDRILQAGNLDEAQKLLERSDATIAGARSQLLKQQMNAVAGAVFSPLLAHFGLVPDHLNMSLRLSSATWNPNGLTGGDFENLQQMTAAGWVNRREEFDWLGTKVELQKSAAIDGVYGLKLSVVGNGQGNTILQHSPLWIESAPVKVQKDQLVRIHGFINVDCSTDWPFGFQIIDSIGKDELSTQFQSTGGWREFTIYRVVPRDGNVTLTFSMNGIGTAMVDEVTVRTLSRTGSTEQANSSTGQIK